MFIWNLSVCKYDYLYKNATYIQNVNRFNELGEQKNKKKIHSKGDHFLSSPSFEGGLPLSPPNHVKSINT